ncbi:putative virion core protein [Lumpy skin disease virus]|uniref:Putative virion core protein n=1 Tax=Lumpy skin disease virus TaxID=59509 RepID=A0A6G8IYR1_LSDV|nr:putative virion core protein [Lumpy skin disease virus]
MMPINAVTTLDQLEDSEYLFKVISSILPSLCLDYKVDENLKTSYVHPFDVLLHPDYGKICDENEIQNSIEKLGINYLLDVYSSNKLFHNVINPGYITPNDVVPKFDSSNNPIVNTHSFNDLPKFTRELLMYRLKYPEYNSRFVGGYVKPVEGGFDIQVEEKIHPDLNFENTYLLNLLYKDVLSTSIQGFRVRKSNGVMFYRDFENLLGVRRVIDARSINKFDEEFKMFDAAIDHNTTLPPFQRAMDTDILTMSMKHFIIYYQYFSNEYENSYVTFNGDYVLNSIPDLISIITSMRFQDQIPKLIELYPDLTVQDYADLLLLDTATNNRYTHRLNNLNIKYVDISGRDHYYINLLNLLAKESRSRKLTSKLSLFWDGIDYQEYKSKKISDIIFYNATCYVMALFNKNGTTYCSMLSDVISSNETPLRVCLLPRVLSGKTVSKLISEVLESVNSISKKDFPKRPASKLMHIGLSENSFMRFFQLLRLITNKSPELSIKEVLMLYAGLKIDDNGSPHLIKKESYQDFSILLFSAMGFKVSIKKSIIGSNNHTIISVRPRVSKQYIHNMLVKASCTKEEADKLISASYDLLHFMVSAGDYRNYQEYYYTKNFFPSYFFYGGNPQDSSLPQNVDEETTLIHISEPINILDRIDIRGIFSANTTDEMMTVDAFGPENIVFKKNLENLIRDNKLSGDTLLQTMPLNILDKLITVAGSCNVSFNDLIDGISNENDDCDSTNDITELINTALKENYAKKNTSLVTQTFNSVASVSQKQFNDIKQTSCQMAYIFKNLARSIYTIEKIFNAKLSDDVKVELLEKLKSFSHLSKSLYQDLISVETLKAILYIIKRNGRTIDDVEIGSDEIRKSYEIIKPKIINMTNYYTEMSRAYFNFIKKNLNMDDKNLITFDIE